MNDWLWTELHHHFDTDDGSLPELPEVAEHFQTCWSRFVSEDGT